MLAAFILGLVFGIALGALYIRIYGTDACCYVQTGSHKFILWSVSVAGLWYWPLFGYHLSWNMY